MAEVKRAYRRLAKAFHPDSAGEATLPRFLAIHEAYERLTTGRIRPTARPSTQTRTTSAEPWRADPERARTARERSRRRPGQTRSGGRTGTAGAPFESTRKRPTGSSGPTATGGSGTREKGRRRDVRKATMGSTSYDEARDPADATWSGASWYGPTTGEYWIVNPREYADPRKHGPGYQQRGSRPSGAASEPLVGDAGEETVIEQREAPVGAASAAGRAEATAGAAASTSSRDARRWDATARPGWAAASARAAAAAAAAIAADGSPRGRPSTRQDDGPGDAGFDPLGQFGAAGRDWLGTPADDPIRRLGLALVAWPPIGLAAAAAIGDITGCTAYSAECGGSDMLLPWLAQAAILGLLLLVPPLARLFVGGTIAVLLALVPITAFLLVVGAGGAPQAALVMAGLLALAWVAGVGWAALAGRRRRAAGLAP